ncbi:SIR2 family protein [Methylobacterium sp. J-088]|uniref:P-loop NTPase n=1 Tax=Methylobacterium sp. J-088 TaxID=2836664 RepID=UPI001FB8A133|nr:SIR2 family protein [Methylobacterium sp. J-088]MCJ2063325.1 SIR2 family protein [Methylobacterium sp. J-088]
MPEQIPAELIAAVREGRAVLLLGAGASFGASDGKGDRIPLGNAVAKELVDNFLGNEYAGLDFRTAYDLSCSQRDVRTIQKYIHDRLLPFQPTDFHSLIPTFSWGGILSTNYDLIIERSYKDLGDSALQKLLPHVKDSDGATNNQDDKTVLYVKLHGCITRHTEISPPLIASTEQLITFREGRKGQFDIFLEWSRNKTIVFVGYAFGDPNLRQLLDEIVKEGDNRPRHFIVDPMILPAFADYWRDRRFVSIKVSFEDFLNDLDRAIPSNARSLSSLSAALSGETTFHKFITLSGRNESHELTQYLKFGIDHIIEGFQPEQRLDIKTFYKGFDLGWAPFYHDLDIERKVSDAILSEHVIAANGSVSQRLVVLKGHAGSGKTVSLRRACWDAGTQYDKLCFFVGRDATIKVDLFDEIFSLTNIEIFLFVDGLSLHKRRIIELLTVAKNRKAGLTIIGSETFNTWNSSCDDLERFVSSEYEMNSLSEAEIDLLITKLEQNDSLGTLKLLSREKRREQFTVAYARQILVALLETTHGLPLVEILKNEYRSIAQPEARLIYLDICSLHRFGPPVRAGIISRIHGITFDQFEERFFKPLEQIVKLKPDRKSGDYVYEARHPQIADALYEAILTDQSERFDNLSRVISKLNPSYSYDLEVLSRIIRAENIERTISDPVKARQIYEIARESMGDVTVILHQCGIYEMRIAGSLGELRKANEFLTKASEKEPRNKSLKHSLAELDLKRSRMASDALERSTWRRSAIERASELTVGDTSPYPYHTILKAHVDDVVDSLAAVEIAQTDANTHQLGEAILKAEDTLKRGLQKFPDDQSLLSGEGNLAEVLSNSNRAEGAFKKAFLSNPRSTLVARRLVKILRSKGELDESIAVLSKCLEANPASSELHYELARVLMGQRPDADQINAEAIAYHLRRSFFVGDKNYRAQFWYARQLCVMDKFTDSRSIFDRLADLSMSFSQKQHPQAHIKDADGVNRRYSGSITRFKSTFGFARSNVPDLELFVPVRELDVETGASFVEGTAVTFEIAFNFRGPVATSVRRMSSVI